MNRQIDFYIFSSVLVNVNVNVFSSSRSIEYTYKRITNQSRVKLKFETSQLNYFEVV